jgi:colicin import membrane protein
MPWEILKKAIFSAIFIHLLLFLAIAVPSGNPVRKKFVRVSLYSAGGGKEKKETKGLPAIEKVEGNEVKAESAKEEIREEVKKEEHPQVRTPEESPWKSQIGNKEKQKEEKARKQDVSKKEVALKKDKEKKLEGIKGKRESKGGDKKEGDKEKKTVSQKPSGGEIKEGTGKGGSGEGMGKGEKEGEGEEFIPKDMKTRYANILWKTVKEKWAIVSPLKGKNLKVEVLVKISSDGKIIERKIEKSSGNPTFDAIALSVIDSIETFSPPPWNPKKPVEIIFIFSSE